MRGRKRQVIVAGLTALGAGACSSAPAPSRSALETGPPPLAAPAASAPPTQDEPVREVAPAAPRDAEARITALDCDVWGGDGENLPALWTLRVSLAVTSGEAGALSVERMSFRLKDLPIDGKWDKRAEIAAGASVDLRIEKRLSLDALGALRKAGEVTVRAELELRVGGGALQTRSVEATLSPQRC